jgi:hypothetical protein
VLLIVEQSSSAITVAATGVEQSDRRPMTMAGGDLLSLPHGLLGAVLGGRA